MSSLFAKNGPVAQLATWLKDKPGNAAELRVVVRDGEQLDVLKAWPADAVTPDLAQSIEDELQHWVTETRMSATGLIQWRTGGGELIQQRRRVVRSTLGDADGITMEGNAQSVLAQTQAHQQVLMEHFVAAMHYVVSESGERVKAAYEKMVEAEKHRQKLQSENDALHEELLARQAEGAIEKAEQRAEEAAESDPVQERMLKYMDVAAEGYFRKKASQASQKQSEGDEGSGA